MTELVALQTDPAALTDAVNYVWVLTVTFLIFFMHAGFAMLEAGQVRSKNVANQLTKNMLTWSVGVTMFFLVGATVEAITAGVTGGGSYELFAIFSPESTLAWVDWLFGAVFAMTAATIVSGAVAGRMKLRAYVTYTVFIGGVIYPVVTGMTWAGGFLSGLGFTDFAGGMIVHGMGGIAGLTAAAIVGPRLDRYNEDGSVNVIPGHSITFAVLGTLILCFGWYGFNVGTAAAPLAEGAAGLDAFGYVGRVALTTTLGMAAGAIGASTISLFKTGKVDTLTSPTGRSPGWSASRATPTSSPGGPRWSSAASRALNCPSSSSSSSAVSRSTTSVRSSRSTVVPVFWVRSWSASPSSRCRVPVSTSSPRSSASPSSPAGRSWRPQSCSAR
jgi:Amt family ammonium transporter